MFNKKEMEIINGLKKEIEDLIYKSPKCDFEHIWNCTLDKALECFNGYEEDT